LCCVVAALTSADADEPAQRRALNLRRLERYLRMAHECRIPALVLINKADLLDEDAALARLSSAKSQLGDARVLLVSASSGLGLEALTAELGRGTTAVLLGSSGVGKSTLVNALLGRHARKTGAEREDDTRGRHTTTERQLLRLAHGGLLIDTPGMRELALFSDADAELSSSGFADIDALAAACHFRDCSHHGEPGCAVQAAIAAGSLSEQRLDHARKLERELTYQKSRVDARLRSAQAQRFKARARAARALMKQKGRG
jgi:ribosome biogenesis GTPase